MVIHTTVKWKPISVQAFSHSWSHQEFKTGSTSWLQIYGSTPCRIRKPKKKSWEIRTRGMQKKQSSESRREQEGRRRRRRPDYLGGLGARREKERERRRSGGADGYMWGERGEGQKTSKTLGVPMDHSVNASGRLGRLRATMGRHTYCEH